MRMGAQQLKNTCQYTTKNLRQADASKKCGDSIQHVHIFKVFQRLGWRCKLGAEDLHHQNEFVGMSNLSAVFTALLPHSSLHTLRRTLLALPLK